VRGAKELVRRAVSRAVVASGISAVGRRVRPKRGALILYGHRVSDDAEGYLEGTSPQCLADQVAYLARRYEIIPFRTLLECFEERREVPSNSVVLTFDDGFRDNLEHALPVLERHRAPATVFLVTDSLTTGELPWSQRLGCLFQYTARRSVVLDLTGGSELDFGSPAARHRAYRIVKEILKPMSRERRERSLHAIASALEVEPPKDRMLSWDDARALQSAGWELGAHTVSHPWLAQIPRAEALEEMERSRDELGTRLGIERPSFAFPAGSYDDELIVAARGLGFRSLFVRGAGRRVNSLSSTDQYSLVRVGLPNAPAYVLEAELDGPLQAVRSIYRR